MNLEKEDPSAEELKPLATKGKVWSPAGEISSNLKTAASGRSSAPSYWAYSPEARMIKTLALVLLMPLILILMVKMVLPTLMSMDTSLSSAVSSSCNISKKDASKFIHNDEKFVAKTANITYKKEPISVTSKVEGGITLILKDNATGKQICSYSESPLSQIFGPSE